MMFEQRPIYPTVQREYSVYKGTETPGMNRMKGTEHEEFILVAEFHEQLGPDPIVSTTGYYYQPLTLVLFCQQ
jgi:hypothetical protein